MARWRASVGKASNRTCIDLGGLHNGARWRTPRVYPGRAMNAVPGAGNCPKEMASAAQRRHRPRHACGSMGLSLAYPVRLRLSHRPPGLPSAPSERLSAGGLLNKAEHHPLPLRVEPIPCLREPDAALGAERWVPCAGAPWRGHQTCDAGTLSASQNSVGDFTVGGRADACLPVERRRGIRAPFATVLGRVRRRTARTSAGIGMVSLPRSSAQQRPMRPHLIRWKSSVSAARRSSSSIRRCRRGSGCGRSIARRCCTCARLIGAGSCRRSIPIIGSTCSTRRIAGDCRSVG